MMDTTITQTVASHSISKEENMTRIDDMDQLVLIPVYNPDVPLPSRGFFGHQLKETFSEAELIDALDNGKTLVYKGNEYYIDYKL